MYLGSYGSGIHCVRQDPATGELSEQHVPVDIANPSFLAWHPSKSYLYAVCEEADTGSIAALAVGEDGALTRLNVEPTGGKSPCHLAIDPTGQFAVVANYVDGTVSVHRINRNGTVKPHSELLRHKGSGPNPDRQAGPHAHMVAFTRYPGIVLVTDLGTDQVLTYRLNPPGKLSPVHTAGMSAGSGPRHMALHPDGPIYITGELDSSVMVCEIRAGALVREIAKHDSMVEKPDPANFPSHIECSDRFVYVANRGADCISVFEADPWRPVADVPTGGRWPRHFALIGDFLYVANQNSGTVTVSRVDGATDVPGPFRVVAEVPGVSCVLPS